MGDLGIPKLRLEVYRDHLPNVGLTPEAEAFDVNATMMWEHIKNSEQESPSNLEFVGSDEYNFGALFPVRSFVEVNNYVYGFPTTSALAYKRIIWNIRTSDGNEPAYTVGPGLADLITNRTQVIKQIPDYNAEYTGPRWDETTAPKSSAIIAAEESGQQNGTQQAAVLPLEAKEYYSSVHQATTSTDVWWCIETHSLKQPDEKSYSNMPFFLDIERKQPQAKNQKTFLMIRINPPELVSAGLDAAKPDIDNSIDILLIDGESPKILDWNVGKVTPTGFVEKPAEIVMNIEQDLSAPNSLRIGFLPVLGKLAVYFNNEYYLYSRIRPDIPPQQVDQYDHELDNSQAFMPFKFLPKVVRVVGSNCVAKVNLSAMGFGIGTFDTLMPATERLNGSSDGSRFSPDDLEKLFILPKENGVTPDGLTNGFLMGVCCREFYTTNAVFPITSDNPAWTTRGKIKMRRVKSKKNVAANDIGGQPQNAQNQGEAGSVYYYQIEMSPDPEFFGEDSTSGGPTKIPNVGPPFFFRIRGGYRKPNEPIPVPPVDITGYLISFSESFGSSDRNCIDHSVDLVIYSPGNTLVHPSGGGSSFPLNDLLSHGFGVVLSINIGSAGGSLQQKGEEEDGGLERGDDQYEPIFTGVSMGGFRTEIAGKETISIKCEDYMIILNHTTMVNSPFYDGMDLFNAVYDLAGRAGVIPVDDTPGTNRYFLPMGYSFTAPAMRFGASTNLKENIKQITAMGERVFYFDNYGVLHMEMLQGGLIFNTASTCPIAHYFQRDPQEGKNVIIDEKRSENNIASTVNGIVVKTVDASNNATIIVGDDATNDEGYVAVVPYKKKYFRDQPAFGCMRATVNWINMVRERMYKPIYGITIKTFNPDIIIPLSFMMVDGDAYRISSFQRSFSAEDNSHTGSLTGEWMGTLTTDV